ncbi:hypothetical protein U9M48_020587 [Paspalum notatum var. saurae]|uniref:Bowman-Birk serine protease inhibitors family domain-containing protein n=1 Tax=Paspalum notatum var. saurae TaxID=547442 RepID=A0AAQ3WS62_PASNO
MKSSTLLTILVLQALLISAAVAARGGHGPVVPKKPCCANCQSWSGVYTCDDLLPKCPSTCKQCQPEATDKGTRYKCRDFLPEGCPCKTHHN